MNGVKFYSEFDMACGIEIDKIISKIADRTFNAEWTISDVLEHLNILKYLEVSKFTDFIAGEVEINLESYSKDIKKKIGKFIGINKSRMAQLFDSLDYYYANDYLEFIEKYNLFRIISSEDFKLLLEKKHLHIYMVMKYPKITEYFSEDMVTVLLNDPKNAETIIAKFLQEDIIYLPSTIRDDDILLLITKYINSEVANLNVLRKIITFPVRKGIKINDKIKLLAKRMAKEEEKKLFKDNSGLRTGISLSFRENQSKEITFNSLDRNLEIIVDANWIKENLDFPTLWNNFIYLFNFVDLNFRISFVSHSNDASVLEALMQQKGEHIYPTPFSFTYREMLGEIIMLGYTSILRTFDVDLENMIDWFFKVYMKDEFGIDDFFVRMPSKGATYFEKCRTVLPEIDRILKQYNMYLNEGKIDHELIQMSSYSYKFKDFKSLNAKKYVYPVGSLIQTASYLIFSDQSGIFYLPEKGNEHNNFFELIVLNDIKKEDFLDHQIDRMKWLIENHLIVTTDDGFIKFHDEKLIYILKDFYDNDVISYSKYDDTMQSTIDSLEKKGNVVFENTLLSKNEQDYFDFYLNKSKFTNGYDIRNSYLHGTNEYDDTVFERDYHKILKLIVLLIIKLNDDIIIYNDRSNKLEKASS